MNFLVSAAGCLLECNVRGARAAPTGQSPRTIDHMHRGTLDHRATPLRFAGAVALVLGAFGCAAAPPRAQVTEAAPVVEKVDTGATFYESEIGGMNEYAVDDAFKTLSGPITRCLETGTSRVEALGGSFTVSFRVDRKGGTRWAYMKSSTLGDRATESCVLEIVRRETWPKPLSGEGLAQKTFEIEPSAAPHVVDEKRVRGVVKMAQKKTASCRKGVQGAFLATAYLEPNGRVRAVGVAPPDEKGESVVDCVVDEIHKLKFSGTGKLAKVSFEI